MKKKESEIDINVVRRWPEIEELLKKSTGWGRTWSKEKDSELYGSHITFISSGEVVIIVGKRNGGFAVLRYERSWTRKTKSESLAKKIAAIFEKKQ
jgi:hypothetical protein